MRERTPTRVQHFTIVFCSTNPHYAAFLVEVSRGYCWTVAVRAIRFLLATLAGHPYERIPEPSVRHSNLF